MERAGVNAGPEIFSRGHNDFLRERDTRASFYGSNRGERHKTSSRCKGRATERHDVIFLEGPFSEEAGVTCGRPGETIGHPSNQRARHKLPVSSFVLPRFFLFFCARAHTSRIPPTAAIRSIGGLAPHGDRLVHVLSATDAFLLSLESVSARATIINPLHRRSPRRCPPSRRPLRSSLSVNDLTRLPP